MYRLKSRWMWLFDSGQRHTVKSEKYLTLVMFGHARAGCCERNACVLDTLGIPLRLVLSLGMDGLNVTKSIMHKINQVKKGKGYQPLVKCPPSCPIHICHNSFQTGMSQYGFSAEELCLNLYYFFKRSSCR